MKNLPVEIKLKILKYFDFDDLFSLKQTNRHFRNLIFKYEDDLARKKHRSLSIVILVNFIYFKDNLRLNVKNICLIL